MALDTIQEALEVLNKTPRQVTVKSPVAAAGDYTAGDVISNSATAGQPWFFPLDGESGELQKVMIVCSTTGLVPRLTLQLYSSKPTCVLNDNVASTGCLEVDTGFYQGYVDLPAMRDLGTGQSETLATPNTPAANLPLPYTSPNGGLWGVIVTRDAEANEAAGMRVSVTLQVKED